MEKETNKTQDKDLLGYKDRDYVCNAISEYASTTRIYEGIRDQIAENIMERYTPEAWEYYCEKEKAFIIEQTAKEIRGIR